ncbi:MAG: tetratricopeptide repeat protein, partial [Bacteroidota bacterium]
MGFLLLPVSHFATDLDNWKDSLQYAQAPHLRATLCYKIGRSLKRKKPTEAQTYLLQGLEALQGTTAIPLKAKLLDFLGQVHRYQSDYAQALKMHQWSATYVADTLEKPVSAFTLLNTSLAHKGLGQYSLAISYMQEALNLYEEAEQASMIANCYNNLGNIYRLMGDYSRAIHAHERALDIREEEKDLAGIAFSYHNLGLIYQSAGLLDDAERLYDQAICLKDSLGGGIDSRVATSYLNLGELFQVRGDHETARKFYEKSLRRALLYDDIPTIAECYSNIGMSYLEEDQGTFAKAPLFKAVRLLQASPTDQYAKMIARQGLWLVKYGDSEAGMDSLRRSLVLARISGNRDDLIGAYHQLKVASAHLGDFDNALHWEESLGQLKDSLFTAGTQGHLAAQVAQFGLEQARIEQIKREEAFEKERLTYLWLGNGLVAAFLLALGAVLAYRNRRQTEVNKLLTKHNEKIAQANFDLRHANHEMEQVIHVLSHELKTPVRNVGGYVSLLRRRYLEQLDDDGRQFVNYAMDGVKNINQLLNDLLQYAQIGTRKSITTKESPIRQVIARVTQELMPQIEAYDAQLEVAAMPDLEVNYRAFYLVFRHLIDNAIKFREPARQPKISIGYRSEPGRHLFWV